MTKKRKPHDPAAAAKLALERAETESEVQRLKAMGATVTRAPNGKITAAYRSNVANLLLSRGTITQSHHDAFHRLAASWAKWKGLDGGAEGSPGKVDGGAGCREIVTDRMLAGGREVWAAFDMLWELGHPEVNVIYGFMKATVEEDRPMAWRGIVEHMTSVANREKQTALVVSAFEQLRAYYEEPRRVAA